MIELNKVNKSIFTVKGELSGNQLVSETGEKYNIAFYNKDYQALTKMIDYYKSKESLNKSDVSNWKIRGYFLLRTARSSSPFLVVVNFLIEAVVI